MAFLYVVRCNFTRPDLERSWNDWYNGDKIRQLLAKPMFRAVQRFKLSSGRGRNYLAIWQVVSPDAFNTPQYRSDWGFFEWERHVTDWSRDLFDAGGTTAAALAVPLDGFLRLIAFDGLSMDKARAGRELLAARTEMMWFKSAGLDRHTPLIGLSRQADATMEPSPPLPAGVQAAVYQPICAFTAAAAANPSSA
jgi:hypothetical protein